MRGAEAGGQALYADVNLAKSSASVVCESVNCIASIQPSITHRRLSLSCQTMLCADIISKFYIIVGLFILQRNLRKDTVTQAPLNPFKLTDRTFCYSGLTMALSTDRLHTCKFKSVKQESNRQPLTGIDRQIYFNNVTLSNSMFLCN